MLDEGKDCGEEEEGLLFVGELQTSLFVVSLWVRNGPSSWKRRHDEVTSECTH